MAELGRGTRVGGYVILEPLGRGAMGVVYRAEDVATHRPVALKLLAPSLLADLDALDRSAREARAAASVQDPGVVSFLGAGTHAGVPWLAFELVTGGSLADLLKRQGRLPWREVARLGAKVARALAALHERGLVHRDVKPANILLDAAGDPKVADLGLAWGFDLAKGASLTATGEILGTPHYISPEQIESRRATGASDLYALGGTLHTLLTGEPPFKGTSVELLHKHLRVAPPPPRAAVPEIPAELDGLVLRLLAKQPVDRPANAREVADALDAIAGRPDEASAPARSRSAVAVLAVLAALGAALAGGVAARRSALALHAAPTAVTAPAPPAPVAPVPTAAAPAAGRSFAIVETRGSTRARLPARSESIAFVGGRAIAVGLEDGGVITFDFQTGELLRVLRSGGERVVGLGWDMADKLIVVGDSSGLVEGFSFDGRRVLLSRERGPLHRLVMSHDGEWTAVSGSAGVRVFRTANPSKGQELGVDARAFALAIGRKGDNVIFGTEDGDVVFQDREGRELFRTKERAPVRAVTISNDSKVCFWATEEPDGASVLRSFDAGVTRHLALELGVMALAGTGSHKVWAGQRGGDVVHLDLKDPTRVERLAGHTTDVTALSFAPRFGVLAAAKDQSFRVWSVDGSRPIVAPEDGGPVAALAVSADGDRVAAADLKLGVSLWTHGNPRRYSAGPPRRLGRTFRVAFSPDGSRVGALQDGASARLIDFESGKDLLTWRPESPVSPFAIACTKTTLMALTTDGREARIATTDPLLGERRVPDLEVAVAAAALSSNGDLAAMVGADGSLVGLDFARSTTVWTDRVPGAGTIAVAEKALRGLLGFKDGHAEVRDLGTGALVASFDALAPGERPFLAALSPDGRTAVLARAEDTKARIWDLAVSPPRVVSEVDIAKRQDRITAVAFQGDRHLLLGSIRGVVYEVEQR